MPYCWNCFSLELWFYQYLLNPIFFVDFAVKLIHEFQCSLNCKNQNPIVLIRSVARNLFKEWEFILGVFWGDNVVGIIKSNKVRKKNKIWITPTVFDHPILLIHGSLLIIFIWFSSNCKKKIEIVIDEMY